MAMRWDPIICTSTHTSVHLDPFIRTAVGANVSRPAPIYRPSLAFRFPDEKVKKHDRAHGEE